MVHIMSCIYCPDMTELSQLKSNHLIWVWKIPKLFCRCKWSQYKSTALFSTALGNQFLRPVTVLIPYNYNIGLVSINQFPVRVGRVEKLLVWQRGVVTSLSMNKLIYGRPASFSYDSIMPETHGYWGGARMWFIHFFGRSDVSCEK